MNPFEQGDPYVEWNEENSAKEEHEKDEEKPSVDSITFIVGNSSRKRLNRIMQLMGSTEREALFFCISAGWLAAEKLEMSAPKYKNLKQNIHKKTFGGKV